jgi:hypothetical protein
MDRDDEAESAKKQEWFQINFFFMEGNDECDKDGE